MSAPSTCATIANSGDTGDKPPAGPGTTASPPFAGRKLYGQKTGDIPLTFILGEVQIVGSAHFVRLAFDANEQAAATQDLTLAVPKLQGEPDANSAGIKHIHEQLTHITRELSNHIFALTVLAREDLGISFNSVPVVPQPRQRV